MLIFYFSYRVTVIFLLKSRHTKLTHRYLMDESVALIYTKGFMDHTYGEGQMTQGG